MNTNHFSNDYDGQTVLSPLGFAAVLVLGVAMILLPRRWAAVPMLVMACFIPPAQRVIVFSLNFDLLRIMVVFGTIRVLARSEWQSFLWTPLDYLLLTWTLFGVFASVVVYGSAEALKYKLGASYDAIGMYFLFRMLVREWTDLDVLARAFAILSLPVLCFFLVESSTGHNLFAAMGGVPAITDIRDGRLRCQGAFAHSILAGCFWACAMPMIAAGWWRRSMPSVLVIGGLCASLGIVALTASSTPVSAVLLAVPSALLFRYRLRMRHVRYALLAAAIVLQLLMNHPIWFLLARIDFVGGSTGWFRYNLMQQAINHAGEWFLIGSGLGTEHWGWGLHDVTNFYVVQGLHGGIILLALFIAMIAIGLQNVGQVVRSVNANRGQAVMAWALGVALFLHATSFIAVSYFGQINVIWYLQLAIIGSLRAAYVQVPRRIGARVQTRAGRFRGRHTGRLRKIQPVTAPPIGRRVS